MADKRGSGKCQRTGLQWCDQCGGLRDHFVFKTVLFDDYNDEEWGWGEMTQPSWGRNWSTSGKDQSTAGDDGSGWAGIVQPHWGGDWTRTIPAMCDNTPAGPKTLRSFILYEDKERNLSQSPRPIMC